MGLFKRKPKPSKEFTEELQALSAEYERFAKEDKEGFFEVSSDIMLREESAKQKLSYVFKDEKLIVREDVKTKDNSDIYGYPRYSIVSKDAKGEYKMISAKLCKKPNVDMRCVDEYFEVTDGIFTDSTRNEGIESSSDLIREACSGMSLCNSVIEKHRQQEKNL